jgi:hypothetical protein
VAFHDKDAPVFSKTTAEVTADWRKLTVEFTVPRNVDTASFTLSAGSGSVKLDHPRRKSPNASPRFTAGTGNGT